MNIEEVKDVIVKLYDRSLRISSKKTLIHPVRVVESTKSIVGIYKEKPLTKLIDFCNDYVNSFDEEENFPKKVIESIPKVVTYLDLELSLLDKNKKQSLRYIYYLSCVSDGKHVLEFLLEFSLKYCVNSYLYIWAVYRMQLFLQFKDCLNSLNVCVEYILKDEYNNKRISINEDIDKYLVDYVPDRDTLNILLTLYNIYNDNLVRKDKINLYIISLLKEHCNFDSKDYSGKVLKGQKKEGRKWVITHLDEINYKSYSVNLILNLDSVRGTMKLLDDSNKKNIIWGYLNQIL